jgi:hypothetical protein
MSTQIILKVLALRHRLRQRNLWTRCQLDEFQGQALRLLLLAPTSAVGSDRMCNGLRRT